MRRAGFVLLVLASGCFNHCDTTETCPSQAEISSLDGQLCDQGRQAACANSTTYCVCDSTYGRWRCDTNPADLSVRINDLATAGVGCASYVGCLVDCFATTVNASVATCEANCAPSVSGAAVLAYTAAVDCAEAYCVGTGDGGSAACLRAADGSLINEDGSPRSPTDSGSGQKRCNLCLHDATAQLYGETCTQPDGADCNPSSCTASVDSCLAD